MDFSFAPALEAIDRDGGVIKIANEATPSAEYKLAKLLPEEKVPSYHVENATVTVRSPMAGIVAMDSPLPEGMHMTAEGTDSRTLKAGIQQSFNEAALRRLQEMAQRGAFGVDDAQGMVNQVLNWFDKTLMQPHFDLVEYLRGKVLTEGKLDFVYNGVRVNVDYGVPAGNIIAKRTGTAGYAGSASVWWTDRFAVNKLLRGGLAEVILNSATAYAIIENPVNNIRVVGDGDGFIEVIRYDKRDAGNVVSEEKRERVRFTLHDLEVDLYDPKAGTMTPKKIIPDGIITFVGRKYSRSWSPGQGSTQRPDADRQLGYVHIAPTVEGTNKGQPGPGRFARVYTPEATPERLVGQAVANLMPVITEPSSIVVLNTDMPA